MVIERHNMVRIVDFVCAKTELKSNALAREKFELKAFIDAQIVTGIKT